MIFDPNLIIVDHYNSVINQVDIKVELLLSKLQKKRRKKHIENKSNEINNERQKLINKINEVKEKALNSTETQESFETKWKHLIHNEQIDYLDKLDIIKDDLIKFDFILMLNLNYKIKVSLCLVNFYVKKDPNRILDYFDSNFDPLPKKCILKYFEDQPFPTSSLKIDALEQKSVEKINFLNQLKKSYLENNLIMDLCYIDLKSSKTFQLNLTRSLMDMLFEVQLIKNDAFIQLKHLEVLDLSSSKYEKIELNVFNILTNLKKLILRNNDLTEINEELFLNLNNLELLDLSSNNLAILKPKTFRYLKNLKKLNLSYNFFTSINLDMFYGLENLLDLNFYRNNLETLDSNLFKYTKKLESLDLNYNHLKAINRETFSFIKDLKFLYLIGIRNTFGGEISSDVFADLNKLKCINLPRNQINNTDLKISMCQNNPNLDFSIVY